MEDFYLTLPSNVFGEGNLTNNFRTELPETIKLDGRWDVALVEMQYPMTWDNVDDRFKKGSILRNNGFKVQFKECSIDDCPGGNWEYGMDKYFSIEPGHYMSVLELLEAIRESMIKFVKQETRKIKDEVLANISDGVLLENLNGKEKKRKKRQLTKDNEEFKTRFKEKCDQNPYLKLLDYVELKHDFALKRVFAHVDMDAINHVQFSKKLQYMLGFEDPFLNNKKMMAKYPPDMRGGVESLYVYCDLIENQFIGDTRAPLLRIIPVKGRYNEIVGEVYTAPHYVPVLRREFYTVEISIKTDQDLLVPFQFGKVIVKLHFRRRL